MVSCKIYQTGEVCEIIQFLADPSTGKRWVKLNCNGIEKTIPEEDVVPMSEQSLPEKSGVASSGRRTYIERPCTLSKSRFPHHFEMIDVKSATFGISSMRVPAVHWEFIGNCILTSPEDLDQFQFDASAKSAFQDNFFSKFDINVSYAREGANHYVCFKPTSESIMEFVRWIPLARSSRPELTKALSSSVIELYSVHSKLTAEKKAREDKVRSLAGALPFPFFLGSRVGMSESALLSMPLAPPLRLASREKAAPISREVPDKSYMISSILQKKTSRF
jgi:hypothetical protein